MRRAKLRTLSLAAKLILLLLSGVLSACAAAPLIAAKDIDSIVLSEVIPLGFEADKALLFSGSDLIYALSVKDQEVTIFRSGNRQNVLGGLGSGSANFQYLSDIALDRDGNLLVLDSSARLIRKFTSEGTPAGSLELKGSQQPSLLALAAEQTLFVYDAAPAEIIAYSALDGTEQFRFGRFQLKQLSSLSCNRDFLVAYSAVDKSSRIFSTLGQFSKNSPGISLFDDYNNELSYSGSVLKGKSGTSFLALNSEPRSLCIDGDKLLVTQKSELYLFKLSYLQVR